MDLIIGLVAIIIVVIVILSPFFQGLITYDANKNLVSDGEQANLMDLKQVLELDYALGNMSEQDFQSQLTEYNNRIDELAIQNG